MQHVITYCSWVSPCATCDYVLLHSPQRYCCLLFITLLFITLLLITLLFITLLLITLLLITLLLITLLLITLLLITLLFITGFPQGLDQDVGESGTMLSGGQRARVALARSVYARADVTVLDDPLCALDPRLRAQVFGVVVVSLLSY